MPFRVEDGRILLPGMRVRLNEEIWDLVSLDDPDGIPVATGSFVGSGEVHDLDILWEVLDEDYIALLVDIVE